MGAGPGLLHETGRLASKEQQRKYVTTLSETLFLPKHWGQHNFLSFQYNTEVAYVVGILIWNERYVGRDEHSPCKKNLQEYYANEMLVKRQS